MPRAMWSGAISFGLVNIPIRLHSAVSRKSVHFNQIDTRTGARIQYRKVSAADGEEVPSEQIAKGYQLSSGEYVLVGDDELGALDPEASRSIDIEQFVDLDEIDPIYYDSAYYVAPDKAARSPTPCSPGRWRSRTRWPSPASSCGRSSTWPPSGRRTACWSCRRWSMPTRSTTRPSSSARTSPTRTSATASSRWPSQLVESLTEPFEPERFEDNYRNQVLDLIDRKAAGEEIVAAPAPVAEDKVVDLMAALEASVRDAKAARAGTRRPRRSATTPRSTRTTRTSRRRRRRASKASKASKSTKATKASKSTKRRRRRRSSPQVGLTAALRPGLPARHHGRDRGPAADPVEPRQGALPRDRHHQGRGHRLLRPHRPGDGAPPGRPGVTLRRFPDGVEGNSFFEKRCPGHRPEWLGTVLGPG